MMYLTVSNLQPHTYIYLREEFKSSITLYCVARTGRVKIGSKTPLSIISNSFGAKGGH